MFLLGLAIVALLASSTAVEQSRVEPLGCICGALSNATTSSRVSTFGSVRAVLETIDYYESTGGIEECCKEFGESLSDLQALLTDENVTKDICSRSAYEKIREFHLKYIHYYNPELKYEQLVRLAQQESAGTKLLRPIPDAFANFFILFVKQITGSCKQLIQPRLEKYVGHMKLVGEREFSIMQRHKEEAKRLMGFGAMGLLESIKKDTTRKFDRLEVMDWSHSTDEPDTKLYLLVPFNDRLKRIQEACLRKFKPVYDQVFVPVIRLNNLGYYDHWHSKAEDKVLAGNEDLTKWYDIIQACELFRDVEILHDSSAHLAIAQLVSDISHISSAQDRAAITRITLLTKEEARELKNRVARSEIIESFYSPKTVRIEREPVNFAPRLWLTSEKGIESELNAFRKDLKGIIARKTNKIKRLKNEFRFTLKNFFYKHKQEVVTRDSSSALGRLSAFLERHSVAVRIALIFVAVAILTAHLAG